MNNTNYKYLRLVLVQANTEWREQISCSATTITKGRKNLHNWDTKLLLEV